MAGPGTAATGIDGGPTRGNDDPSADELTAHVGSPPDELEPTGPHAEVGSNLGRYVVLEEVGRGGMGRVVRAYDPKLQREVALKEVHRHKLGADESQRLIEEARSMAKLSHPNVVAVYDVEAVESGRIVLVMEYVDGVTLREWLRAETRPWREIVDRFIAAARGLAAAHAAGLLHRDFKPANVLVSGDTVKVTDFGLAKPSGMSSESESGGPLVSGETREWVTQAGMVVGTPRYMAPEQHAGEVLTPAADQYALCVSLWEALAGKPPFNDRREGLLRQKEDGAPANAPDVPRPIVDALRRGLAPLPGDRFPTLEALMDALAYDPARRRRDLLVGAAAVVVLAGGGIGWWSWAQFRAGRCAGADAQLEGVWDEGRRGEARDAMLGIGASYATTVWDRTATALDGYAEGWVAMHTEACEATTVRGEQSSLVLDLRMACLHRAKVELTAVADVLVRADADVVQNAHALVEHLPPLDRCADVEALSADVEPPLPEEAEAVEAIRASLSRAKAEHDAGHLEAARAHIEEAKQRMRADGVEYGPVQTQLVGREASTLEELGDYEGAIAATEEGMRLAAKWGQRELLLQMARLRMFLVGYYMRDFEAALQHRELMAGLAAGDAQAEATNLFVVATIYRKMGKLDEAAELHLRALAIREEGGKELLVAQSLNNLGNVYATMKDYDRAVPLLQRSVTIREKLLGPDHPDVSQSLNNLGAAQWSTGDLEGANRAFERALEIRLAALGEDHPDMVDTFNNLATIRQSTGDHQQSIELFERALAVRVKNSGPEDPGVAELLVRMAGPYLEMEDYDSAIEVCQRAVEILEAVPKDEKVDMAGALNELAKSHSRSGDHREALKVFLRAQEVLEHRGEIEGTTYAGAVHNVAAVREKLGEDEAARGDYQRAVALYDRVEPSPTASLAKSLFGLARVELALEHGSQALAAADRALELRKSSPEASPPAELADTRFLVAKALVASGGSRERAIELAEQARDAYQELGKPSAKDLTRVKRWLRGQSSSAP